MKSSIKFSFILLLHKNFKPIGWDIFAKFTRTDKKTLIKLISSNYLVYFMFKWDWTIFD